MKINKPIKLSEKQITQQIRGYLRAKGIFHYKAWQGLGSEKGVPDIVGVLPGGKALYIEVKTATGKLSEYQQRFMNLAESLGAFTLVARSVEDVVSYMNDLKGTIF